MAGPRFGQAPGFGGGFDEPTKGEFQPGTEEGVDQPNWSKACGASMRQLSVSSGPVMRIWETSGPTMEPQCP